MDLWELENPNTVSNSVSRVSMTAPMSAPVIEPVEVAVPQGISYADATRGEEQLVVDIDELPLPGFRGEYPTIRIPKRAYERGLEYCRFSLIGRTDVKDIDVEKLRQKAIQKWQPKGNCLMTPLGKGYIHIKFHQIEDFDKVWSGGPWKIDEILLRLSKWHKNFRPDSQKLTTAPVWVKLPKLPLEFWDVESVMAIGRALGYPIKVDEATIKKWYGFYALVLVDIELTKPIPEQILIEHEDGEFWQDVVITKLPKFCNHCQMVGHWVADCTHVQAVFDQRNQVLQNRVAEHPNPVRVNVQQERQQPQAPNQPVRAQVQGARRQNNNGNPGNWQRVEGRNNNRARDQNIGRNNQRNNGPLADNIKRQNRFNALQNIRAEPVTSGGNVPVVVPPAGKIVAAASVVATQPSLTQVIAEANEENVSGANEVDQINAATHANVLSSIGESAPLVAPLPEGVEEVNHNVSDPVIEIILPIANNSVSTLGSETEHVPAVQAAEAINQELVQNELPQMGEDLVEVHTDSTIDDPGDTLVPETQVTQGEQVEENPEHKKMLEEVETVHKMFQEQSRNWADLLDEEEDEEEREGRTEIRPSLSQPRKSGRSRSRSSRLTPYV